MKSSPVYCIINAEGRKTSPSFGSTGFTQDIRVGTSASNSHTLAKIEVRRHENDDGTVTFVLFLDGKAIKTGLLEGKEYDGTYRPQLLK